MTDWKKLPLIPRDEKRSVKIKSEEIENIKEFFHVKKWTMVKIARLYKVHPITIKRILNPEYRKKSHEGFLRWQKNIKRNSKRLARQKAEYYQRKKKLRDKIGKENVVEVRKLVTKKNNNYNFYA